MKKALTVLLMMMSLPCCAQNDSQTEYNFLRLPASAHAAALGGDNVTVIDDDEAFIFNNPPYCPRSATRPSTSTI